MAKSTKTTAEVRKAILLAETSRIELGLAHSRFKERIDFSGRVKSGISSEPAKWLGGSAVAGFLLSSIFKPKKKPAPTPARVRTVKKERNVLVGVLAILLAIAKPLARIYATKFLKNYLQKRLRRRYLERSGGADVRPY